MLRYLLSAFFIVALAVQIKAFGRSSPKPTCGGTASSKNIRLQTPTTPPRQCVYHINAYSSNVCQLRIDFAMTLAQPTLPTDQNGYRNAKCQDDYFEVAGVRLCGTETQQHIYVPFNRTAGVTKIDLKIVLAARVGWTPLPTPNWNMQVTQLECPAGASIRSAKPEPDILKPQARASIKDGFYVAPPGCLQYFPQSMGAFTSFNFNNGLGVYPGDLNYAICFRRTDQTRALELSALSFNLGAVADIGSNLAVDNFCYPQQRIEANSKDFLMIPQATISNAGIRATYFCGDSATNAAIESKHPGPLMVIFNSEGVNKQSEAGFAFTYKLL